MKPTRTWILIADSGRARVLENTGPGKGLHEVSAMASSADLPRTHDIVTDRQSRAQESSSPARHAIEPKSDPREQLKEHHLEEIADRLDRSVASYDRLVLVAPPQALGVLRKALSERVKALVTGELGKDLTKTPDHELAAHIGDLVRL